MRDDRPEEIDTVVIGAGHAGLAVSNLLSAEGIEHAVLERDRIASAWVGQRWDSFTLLTPNWATWLPGWVYRGDDPHGFMGREEIVSHLDDYAASFGAPVRCGVDVEALTRDPGGGYRLRTKGGEMSTRNVVVATGPFQAPRMPGWASQLPSGVTQLHSSAYRSPDELPDGGVLVVGAGPSGQQIAEDLVRSGRSTHLAVGRHRRVPRRYRGRDYYWWLELGGFYERTAADVPPAGRRDPVAPVLTGFAGGHDLDLRELHSRGVHLLGRAVGTDDGSVRLEANLAGTLASGDQAYTTFTDWVDARLHRFAGLYDEPEPRRSFPDPPEPPDRLDLERAGISTVVWATGYRLDFARWIDLPVFDSEGSPVHRRGETDLPGIYFLGLRWLHRLRSPFIRGAEEDARHVAGLIAARSTR
jgi:putative flavoprotein involved in K+ transport